MLRLSPGTLGRCSEESRVVSKRSCLASAAGGTPRVGQPGWACGHMPASPVLPLEEARCGGADPSCLAPVAG